MNDLSNSGLNDELIVYKFKIRFKIKRWSNLEFLRNLEFLKIVRRLLTSPLLHGPSSFAAFSV